MFPEFFVTQFQASVVTKPGQCPLYHVPCLPQATAVLAAWFGQQRANAPLATRLLIGRAAIGGIAQQKFRITPRSASATDQRL